MLLSPAEENLLAVAARSSNPTVLGLLQIIARIKVAYRIDDIRPRRESDAIKRARGQFDSGD